MTKKELKTANDSEVIVDYIQTYALLTLNYNLRKGIKQLDKHMHDLDVEMLKRGILSKEQVELLNM